MADRTFEGFFRDVLPDALRVARRILSNATDAEDAAAEAFARAHASWRTVGGLDHRRAWVLRVTANVAVDMVRRRSRRGPFPAPDRVDDHAEAKVLEIALAAALAALPRRQREVIVLRYLEGYSEAETADALGISAGTVKKACHRATRTMRERLGAEWQSATVDGGIDAAH